VPRSPRYSVQIPANANTGRFSSRANQTTSFFLVAGFGSGAYSAKLLAASVGGAQSGGRIDQGKKFRDLNEFISSRHGWITSIPGAVAVTVQCLPGSTLPDDLRGLGHQISEAGEGERILATAITERFTRRADGELEPVTEGSTRPVTRRVTHAGIATVIQYDLRML
jgi:hypothetical protein